MENHSVTVHDALRYAVDYMEGRIKDEAFSSVYPDWFFPKLVCVSVTDQEASMLNRYSDFSVEGYLKKRPSEWISILNEYRYGIMIGEVPKWKQKGEEDAATH